MNFPHSEIKNYTFSCWLSDMKAIAIDNVTNNSVIIEFYQKKFSSIIEQKEFDQMTKLYGRMNHPLIQKLFDRIDCLQWTALIFEHAPSGTLKEKLSDEIVSQDEAMKLLIQLVSAVSYLHTELKISHLNLNTETILIDKYGNIKLSGFLYHKMIGQNDMYVNSRNDPYFKSPEISLGKPFSCKADIWSLGVIFYNIMFQELPFDDADIITLTKMITSMQPIYPNGDGGLIDLLKKMLNKIPSERINIETIKRHPFFQDAKFIETAIEPSKKAEKHIIQKMASSGVDVSSVHADVLSKKINRITSIYFQYLRMREIKKLSGRKSFEESSSNEADKIVRFVQFKRHINTKLPVSLSARKTIPSLRPMIFK